tara:strand:+ start:1534 stop:2124 length:591 start_codon:yes stop_codon:yes gene_type:complete
MIKNILNNPLIYKLSQKIFLADAFRKRILKELIVEKNLSILDIGCGPGNMIKYLSFNKYFGFDNDIKYISYASKKYKDCNFFCEIFSKSSINKIDKVDVVMLFGLLHHISNNEALELLENVKLTLKKNSKIVILDPVLIDSQNPIAKFLIKNDRGKFVRTVDEYQEIFKQTNLRTSYKIYHQKIVPYTHIVSEIKN